MPSLVITQSIAAGASVNLVAGTQYEFPQFHAHCEFGLVTTATGMLATIYAGSDLLMQEGPVQIKAVSTFPTYPDDFHVNDDIAANARLNVTVRNTTGGALVVILVIRLNPLS